MAIAWRTFLKYEAADYTKEGVESFRDFISDNMLYKMFLNGTYQLFVAVQENALIGMISVRNINHISLLFVDAECHRKGVGRSLMEYVENFLLSEVGGVEKITVNASPYGIPFYHKIGFRDTDIEQTENGIRYTPMEFVL